MVVSSFSKTKAVSAAFRKGIRQLKTKKSLKLGAVRKIQSLRNAKRNEKLFALTPHSEIAKQKISKPVSGIRHTLRDTMEQRRSNDYMLFERGGAFRIPAADKYFSSMTKPELSQFRATHTNPLIQRKELAHTIRKLRRNTSPKTSREHFRKIAEDFRRKYLT